MTQQYIFIKMGQVFQTYDPNVEPDKFIENTAPYHFNAGTIIIGTTNDNSDYVWFDALGKHLFTLKSNLSPVVRRAVSPVAKSAPITESYMRVSNNNTTFHIPSQLIISTVISNPHINSVPKNPKSSPIPIGSITTPPISVNPPSATQEHITTNKNNMITVHVGNNQKGSDSKASTQTNIIVWGLIAMVGFGFLVYKMRG